jgi:hypothetical protein
VAGVVAAVVFISRSQPACGVTPAPLGPHYGQPDRPEVIVMTTDRLAHRGAAAVWRAACRAAAALRTLHDEQVLMWELFWQSSRVPVDRTGPLTWTPSLDGPRLTGSHLPSSDNASTGDGP